MNQPSLEKFENTVAENGVIVYDSALVSKEVERKDVKAVGIPATKIANDMNASKLANMILLGTLLKETAVFTEEEIETALKKMIPASKSAMLELNLNCIKKGME